MLAPLFYYRWVPGCSLQLGAIVRDGQTLYGPVPFVQSATVVDWSKVCDDVECQLFPNRCDHIGVLVPGPAGEARR